MALLTAFGCFEGGGRVWCLSGGFVLREGLVGEYSSCSYRDGRLLLLHVEQALQEQPHLQHPYPGTGQRRQDHAPLPDVVPSPRRSLGKAVETTPTIGSNVEEFSHKNVRFSAWDLGGQERIRSIWSTYYSRTDAVIFVIDSTDAKSEVIAKTELFKIVIN